MSRSGPLSSSKFARAPGRPAVVLPERSRGWACSASLRAASSAHLHLVQVFPPAAKPSSTLVRRLPRQSRAAFQLKTTGGALGLDPKPGELGQEAGAPFMGDRPPWFVQSSRVLWAAREPSWRNGGGLGLFGELSAQRFPLALRSATRQEIVALRREARGPPWKLNSRVGAARLVKTGPFRVPAHDAGEQAGPCSREARTSKAFPFKRRDSIPLRLSFSEAQLSS